MADDSLMQLLGTGGSVLTGGGVSAVVMRFMFGGFNRRLDEIENTLKALVEKGDSRYEKLIERISAVESSAKRAHDRCDELRDSAVKRRR